MSYKRLSSLLVLGLLATATLISAHNGHKCTHDDQEFPEPQLLDVEEEYNPEGNDHSGRTLADYTNLRTYGYYGLLNDTNAAMQAYVQNELIPPILDYFAASLKVKYPVSGNMTVTTTSVCSVSTPAELKKGVPADFVYFVDVNNSTDYVASSYTCTLATGSKRPLTGKTTISSTYLTPTTDVLSHERQMICIIHEVIHILGFSKSLYGYWLNSTGKVLTNHILSAPLNNITATVINAEPLTTRLRNFFGCPDLLGAYMENTGSSGTYGSHFERRQFSFEGMTSGLINQMQFSQFTFALLESTGWYVPDYSFADPFFFGQGQGCDFLTGDCSASKYDEFCSSSSRACTNPGRGGGSCTDDTRSDGCKFIHPSTSYDCENPDAASYARLPILQNFGRGVGSKCFTGTLNTKTAGSQTTFCFKPTCAGSGTNTTLTLAVGTAKVVCTAEGTKTVSGYAGVINCPDPLTFCSTVGQKICPRGCMGRGNCVNGVCVCKSGFKGTDCALNA